MGFLSLAILAGVIVPGTAGREAEVPFAPGERLTYTLRWNMFKAGRTVLQVGGIEKRGETQAFHFIMETRTNTLIDAIYRVRQRIDAYASLDLNRSLFYRKRSWEGRARRDVKVDFDWRRREAVFTAGGRRQESVNLGDRALDPLSVFFHLRMFDPRKETEIWLPVTDGKEAVVSRTRVVRRETIQVPAGRFGAFLLVPDIKHLRGVFAGSGAAALKVWVTDDDRRIPVRVKSELPMGSFWADLAGIEGEGCNPAFQKHF